MSYPDNDDLIEVNQDVNQLPYRSDAEKYDTPEFWARIGPEGGDCEDFALTKLQRLVALGWPIEKLRLACCYVETGEYHAVLEVDDLVLDNRHPFPMTLDQLQATGYKPDRIQRVGGSKDWAHWSWAA